MDSYWQPVSASLRAADTQVLFDKVGVCRAAPGLATYALISVVRDGLPFAAPEERTVRLRGRVEGFWSDVAIVAKHHARGWGQAQDEAAALRQRSGDVPAGEGGDGTHVDDGHPGCDAVAHRLQIEGQGRLLGAKDGGAESVHLAQTREVGRIGAHAFE
jgi:hypothetical protein